MTIDNLQQQYHIAFNNYLAGIQYLLNSFSIREIASKYPHIEQQHIRLASELKTLDDTINPYCLYELKDMKGRQLSSMIKSIRKNRTTPTQLRKALRDKKRTKKPMGTKPNDTVKSVWLLNRKLNGCSKEERQHLLELINNAKCH